MTSRDIVDKLKAEAASADGDPWRQAAERFESEVADAKEAFGLWDTCDPVAHALVRAVAAQNDVQAAHDWYATCGDNRRMLEEAFKARIEAINALAAAIKRWPRGPA
jgi:hypothetical protein